jgi:hypothetical protein
MPQVYATVVVRLETHCTGTYGFVRAIPKARNDPMSSLDMLDQQR